VGAARVSIGRKEDNRRRDLYQNREGAYFPPLVEQAGSRTGGPTEGNEMADTLKSTDGVGSGPPLGSGVDSTLGGYLSHHNRPPAFEGSDGHPYTVSPEVEKTPNLLAPFSGYLVFPRWAETGVGIVGHLETPMLLEKSSREAAELALKGLTLLEVQGLLETAIRDHETETE